jgi:hypothetical protein
MNQNLIGINTGNNNQINYSSVMKEIFKNNEITIYTSVVKNNESINRCIYISNNTAKYLNNIKITISAPKHLSIKVVNTSGFALEPNQGLGVKKVIKYIHSIKKFI